MPDCPHVHPPLLTTPRTSGDRTPCGEGATLSLSRTPTKRYPVERDVYLRACKHELLRRFGDEVRVEERFALPRIVRLQQLLCYGACGEPESQVPFAIASEYLEGMLDGGLAAGGRDEATLARAWHGGGSRGMTPPTRLDTAIGAGVGFAHLHGLYRTSRVAPAPAARE